MDTSSLDTAQEPPVLRLAWHVAAPPAQVWSALVDDQLRDRWFPARARFAVLPGAPITFDQDGQVSDGAVVEVQAGRVLTHTWGGSLLRWTVEPEAGGCWLRLSQTLDEESGGALAAAQHAAGWDMCAAGLAAALGLADAPGDDTMLPRLETYTRRFGLDEGVVEQADGGFAIRFTRHLTWRPVAQVWAVLVTGSLDATADEDIEQPVRGDRPPWPTRNGYLDANEVTVAAPPHLLEYDWLARGAAAGRVRWELAPGGSAGTAVQLTQTLPRGLADRQALHLAAWHTHLELLFAALAGELRLPWPEERTEELRAMYERKLGAARLGSAAGASADGA